MNKTRWLIYTVIIGLIPIFVRFCVASTGNKFDLNYCFNLTDVVSFGLMLNLTNINELESHDIENKRWKTIAIGLSVILIILFAIFLGLAGFADYRKMQDFNYNNARNFSILLCLSSLLLGYSVQNRLKNFPNG
jgi:hypothetical protein